jgi:hypothetical protein
VGFGAAPVVGLERTLAHWEIASASTDMDRAAPKAAHLNRGDVRARENGRTQPDLATIRGLTRAVKRGAARGGLGCGQRVDRRLAAALACDVSPRSSRHARLPDSQLYTSCG